MGRIGAFPLWGDLTTASTSLLVAYSGIGVFGILGLTFWCLPQTVCLIFVYIMFCRIATLDVRYVLQQWYTTQDCQADNPPRFPNTVYQMIGLVMGNLFTLVGVWLFENYVAYWNARAAFWVTTLFTIVAASFDLMMLTRFNQTLWSFLPFTVLLSKLCPAGVETTVFAMLAAIMNLGLTLSGLLAGFFWEIFRVDIEQCDY